MVAVGQGGAVEGHAVGAGGVRALQIAIHIPLDLGDALGVGGAGVERDGAAGAAGAHRDGGGGGVGGIGGIGGIGGSPAPGAANVDGRERIPDRGFLGATGAVEVLGRVDASGASASIIGGGRHVDIQRAIPDLAGLGGPDAREAAGRVGAVVIAAGATAGALAQEEEHPVAGAGAVVHVEVLERAAPGVGARTVDAGLVHPAQGIGGELLADLPGIVRVGRAVGHHLAVAVIELGQGRNDVRVGFVQATGLPAVGEVGAVGAHAVAHFVGGHIQGGEGLESLAGAAIAVGHAEAAVGPEGVHVVAAVVDAAVGGLAVAIDAVPTVLVLEHVPGQLHAVGGIHGRGLAVVAGGRVAGHIVRAIAPGVVGIGVDRAVAAGALVHVGDHVLAEGAAGSAGHVAKLVAAADAVGGEGHRAAELAAARAIGIGNAQGGPLLDDAAAVGIDHVVGVAGVIAVLDLGVHVIGQVVAKNLTAALGILQAGPTGAVHFAHLGVDHEFRGGVKSVGAFGAKIGVGHSQGLAGAQGRLDGDPDVLADLQGGAQFVAFGVGVGDHFAAPHSNALEELVHAGVGLTEFILDRPADAEIMAGIQAQTLACGQRARAGAFHHMAGGFGLGGQGASDQEGGEQRESSAAMHGGCLREEQEGERERPRPRSGGPAGAGVLQA
ncbi:MAG: hypothetical protein BWY56_01253 [Acidobacteria bacterium ADurb.Bin340]|nr:MAG: hypothetical protein BWY56_01253 [Acidobacteria bacterium ADurb.Bin340]